MRSYSLILTLASVTVIACSDRPTITGLSAPNGPAVSAPSQAVVVSGTLIPNPERSAPYPYAVLDHDGNAWWLAGAQIDQLASGSLVDAQIDVRGTLVDGSGIMVESFLVLEVRGVAVTDGILETAESGFALKLSDGGAYRTVVDPPAELQALLGARVWISGPDDSAPLAFGIISRNPEAPPQAPNYYRLRVSDKRSSRSR